jgi:hypothetical protein
LAVLAVGLTAAAVALAVTGAASGLEAALDGITVVLFALVISAILYLLFEIQRQHRSDRFFRGQRLSSFVRRLSREEIGADHAASWAGGSSYGFGAGLDAIEILTHQHLGAKTAMEALAHSVGAEKKRLIKALQVELSAHHHLEQHAFYAAVQAFPQAAALAQKDNDVQAAVESDLSELAALSVADPRWDERFHSMRAALLKHIGQQEQHYFVRVRQLLSAGQMAELTARMSPTAAGGL